MMLIILTIHTVVIMIKILKFEIAPQRHWGPLEMVWIPPGMWRVVPRGLTVTPREDDGGHDECDDDHPKYT